MLEPLPADVGGGEVGAAALQDVQAEDGVVHVVVAGHTGDVSFEGNVIGSRVGYGVGVGGGGGAIDEAVGQRFDSGPVVAEGPGVEGAQGALDGGARPSFAGLAQQTPGGPAEPGSPRAVVEEALAEPAGQAAGPFGSRGADGVKV